MFRLIKFSTIKVGISFFAKYSHCFLIILEVFNGNDAHINAERQQFKLCVATNSPFWLRFGKVGMRKFGLVLISDENDAPEQGQFQLTLTGIMREVSTIS